MFLISSFILFGDLRPGVTVAHLRGANALLPARIDEVRDKEVVLEYIGPKSIVLPYTEVENLIVVNYSRWNQQFNEDPTLLVASLYKRNRLSWAEANNLLKQLSTRGKDLKDSKDRGLPKALRTHLISDAKMAVAITKAVPQHPDAKASDGKSTTKITPPPEGPSKTPDALQEVFSEQKGLREQEALRKEGSDTKDGSNRDGQSPQPKSWLKGFLLEWSLGLKYDTGGVQEIDQCPNVLLAAWRRQWLSDAEFNERLVALLATTVSYIGNSITSSQSRKKDANKVGRDLKRGLREVPLVDRTILLTCLSAGDGLAEELTELADWAWNELSKREGAEVIPALLTTSAPRWSFGTALKIVLDDPATLHGPQGATLVKVLVRPIILSQDRTDFVPVFRKVLEQNQGGVYPTVSSLMRLLKDTTVPDELTEVMCRATAHIPALRLFFLIWLCQQKDQHLDSVFTALLAAKEVGEGDWLAMAAAGQPAPSKGEIISRHFAARLAGAGFSRNSTGLGLLAFMDAEGTNTSREAVIAAWHQVLVDPPLERLQAALCVVVRDARAPLEADVERAETESARVRTEADGFRQEVKKLSAVAGTDQNPQVSSLSYAKDLIGLIDDLDIQQVQSPALKPAHVRTTKLLLATLKRNGVVVMDPMPGDIILRDEWLIHPDRFRVFADSTDASTLIVAQRGYLIVDVAGREEVFRPVLLDQDS